MNPNSMRPEARLMARRRLVARLVRIGQPLGYGLFLAAAVLFFTGIATAFRGPLVTAIVACLVAGSLVLAPAIVFSYALRDTLREERAQQAHEDGEGSVRG